MCMGAMKSRRKNICFNLELQLCGGSCTRLLLSARADVGRPVLLAEMLHDAHRRGGFLKFQLCQLTNHKRLQTMLSLL